MNYTKPVAIIDKNVVIIVLGENIIITIIMLFLQMQCVQLGAVIENRQIIHTRLVGSKCYK